MKNDYDIAAIYREMELHLIRSLKRNLGRHLTDEIAEGFKWKAWQAEKLKELKRYQRQNKDIIGSYTRGLDKDVSDILKDEFSQGALHELNKYNELFDKNMSDSFFKTDDRKVNALIKSVNSDMKTADKAVLRMMNDTYRQTIHKAAMFANNGVMTQKQAVDMATKDFLSRGLNVIEYKDGKRVNIASYSQMAVRTASQRAMLIGQGEFRKEIGENLVIISKHGTACKLCQPHESKVYIDDVYSNGKPDGKHKLLSQAMKEGLFHPNCRHGVGTYYDLDDEDEKETTDNVPADNNNEKDNLLDRQIQQQKRKIAGFQSPDNLKTAQQRLIELEDQKDNRALNYYVSGDGMYVNNALRGRNGAILHEEDKQYIKDLDNALNHKLDNHMTLYRSVDAEAVFGKMSALDYERLEEKLVYNTDNNLINASTDKYLKNIKGKIITDKGYMSTTKDLSIASDWGNYTGSDKPIVLELDVPKNAKGKDLVKFDLDDDPQKEVLLARNTKYKINDVTAKDGNIYVKASVIDNEKAENILNKNILTNQYADTKAMNEYTYFSDEQQEFRLNSIKKLAGYNDEDAKAALEALCGNKNDWERAVNSGNVYKSGWFYGQDTNIRNLTNIDAVKKADIIDKYIKNSPKYDGTLYRGLALDDDVIKSLKQNGEFIENGSLSSWTNDTDIAEMFAKGRSEELNKKSVIIKCSNIKNSTPVAHLSIFGNEENEVIVSNFTNKKYKVIDITEKDGITIINLFEE